MGDRQKKYEELEDYLWRKIADGSLKTGDRLPSENELCGMFSISRQTVRRAIGCLEERGLVRRIRGSGTYLGSPGEPGSPAGPEDSGSSAGTGGLGGFGALGGPGSQEAKTQREECRRIAVVTTYVDSYIFPRTIQGIEKVLSEHGCPVQIAFTNNTLDRERNVLEEILRRDEVAGMIVEGTKSGLPNPNLPLYRKLLERGIRVLFINAYYPELGAPHVSLDDVGAARTAVEYLAARGHREIGAILKLDDGQGRLRYLGYLQALEAAGLPVNDTRVAWLDTGEAGQLAFCLDRVWERIRECGAVLCYNDQVAFQLVRLLRVRGVKVPERLSVISIDDSDLARHSEVPITSLTHPKERLGEKAAENLLRMLAGERDVTWEFPARVVERGSVAVCDTLRAGL